MAVTIRTAILACAGALLVAFVLPSLVGILAVTGVVLLLALVDLGLAGSVRQLSFARDDGSGQAPATTVGTPRMSSVRLGESVEVALLVGNPGSRRVRGLLRDAWPPSAGAETQRHSVDVPAGQRRRVRTVLRPTRRGDRPAYRVTVRAVGPLGLAARQGSHDVPWTVRALPPFESRKHLPSRLARLRELDGRASVLVRGPGHGVRLAARLRGRRRRPVDRLAGHRAAARRGRSYLAARTRPARPRRARHRTDLRRPGR